MIHFWDSQEQGCIFVGFDAWYGKCPLCFPGSFRELFCDLLLPLPKLASDPLLYLYGKPDNLASRSLLPQNVYLLYYKSTELLTFFATHSHFSLSEIYRNVHLIFYLFYQ